MSNRTHKKIYSGGTKLGQGSYGCVVTPPLKCKNSQLLRRNLFNINENFISKIIKTKFSIEAFTELNIGIKVYNLDLESKYFVPFINACYFKPQKHPDIIYLSGNGKIVSSDPDSIDSELSSYTHLYDAKTDISANIIKEHKTKCILKKNIDYLNLIGPIGGDTINNILLHKKNLFIAHNYWFIAKYLINGLYILHRHKIVHKDIKLSNLIIDFYYDQESSTHLKDSKVRYIDFGLAITLNKKKYDENEINMMLSNGTINYTPLEILALKSLYKLKKKGHNPHSKFFIFDMLKYMIHNYEKNREHYHHSGIMNNHLINENKIHTIEHNKKNQSYYLTPFKYETIFKHILELYKNNKLDNIINELFYGWDIYSLGMVFAKMVIKSNIKDHEFEELIFKMIDINPDHRININDLHKKLKTFNHKCKINIDY